MIMFNKVLIDNRVSDSCVKGLHALGYVVVRLPSFWGLSSPISSHCDILCSVMRDGALLICEEYYLSNKAFFDGLNIKLKLTDEKLGTSYPNDVLFDALVVNGTVYGKRGFVSRHIIEDNDMFIPVKQGYARCSVAMLSERCAVTSDEGLCKALSSSGIKVLLIRPGHIRLDGYSTGFIGGAGGRLHDGTYAFFGDVMSHPDGEEILKFAHENKISAVSLSKEKLCDYGGLILL